jgi:CBS domain-containing protein
MPKVTNQLGLLLLESGFLTDEDIEAAEKRAASTGLPLGRMLVLSDKIDEKLLEQVLETLIHLRDNAMFTEADALEVLGMLKSLRDGDIKEVDQAQLKSFFSKKGRQVRVGELLVRSGLVTETDVMNAVEEGLATRRKVGEVLVSNSYTSSDAVDMALTLLECVRSGDAEISEAAKNLREAHSYPETDDQEG